MAIRDSMRETAQPFLNPGETIQAVIPAQTASAYLAALGGLVVALFFLGLNRYRIIVVTPERIVVMDAGKFSQKKAKGVVTELPRSTRLGPGSGLFHVVPAGKEKLRVHRRFFKDLDAADAATPAAA